MRAYTYLDICVRVYIYMYLLKSPGRICRIRIRIRIRNSWALLSCNHRIRREVSQSAAHRVRRCRGPWQCITVRYSALQSVAVYCSVLQCIAVYCSVLQCVAEQRESVLLTVSNAAEAPSSLLQCVAVCCSVLQCIVVCCSVMQCVAVCSRAARERTTDSVRRRRSP